MKINNYIKEAEELYYEKKIRQWIDNFKMRTCLLCLSKTSTFVASQVLRFVKSFSNISVVWVITYQSMSKNYKQKIMQVILIIISKYIFNLDLRYLYCRYTFLFTEKLSEKQTIYIYNALIFYNYKYDNKKNRPRVFWSIFSSWSCRWLTRCHRPNS